MSSPPRGSSRPSSRTSTSTNAQSCHSKTPLETLCRMGFSKKRALKSLAATGAAGRGLSAVQIASDWLMAHAHDQTLDDQCPRHFHLHLCPGPSTPLAKNLQVLHSCLFTLEKIWNKIICSFFLSTTYDFYMRNMLNLKILLGI